MDHTPWDGEAIVVFVLVHSDSDGFQLVVRGGRPRPVASARVPSAEDSAPPSRDVVVSVQRAR